MRLLIVLLSISALFANRLDINISSNSIYESEFIVANLSFDSDKNSTITRLESRGFEAEDFEVKKLQDSIKNPKRGIFIYRSSWLLKPKKVGKLIIPSQKIIAYQLDKSSYLNKPVEYKTEPIIVQVKRLPKSAILAGDITLEAKVNKTITKANTPIVVTVTIKGRGDLSLIPPFNPKIEDAVVFPTNVKIENKFINGEYISRWKEEIGYSSNRDFTIPPFKIRYLNSTLDTIEVLESKPIDIKVETAVSIKEWLVYFGFMVAGFILATLLIFNKRKTTNNSDIVLAIKKAKNDKELYSILLPYSNNKEISNYIKALENNLYKSTQNRIDRRELISILSNLIKESNP